MIDLRIKTLFFDRQKVKRAVSKANRQALSKAGAFVRQAAKTSIRKRKGTSPPGQPPYSHTGLLRRWILFGYERSSDSVVVGPARLNRPGDAPHALEFGGPTKAVRRRRGRQVERRFRIGKRPYMAPALEKEAPKLPRLWAGSVRGG